MNSDDMTNQSARAFFLSFSIIRFLPGTVWETKTRDYEPIHQDYHWTAGFGLLRTARMDAPSFFRLFVNDTMSIVLQLHQSLSSSIQKLYKSSITNSFGLLFIGQVEPEPWQSVLFA